MPRNVRAGRAFMGQLIQHSAPTIDEREFRVNAANTAMMAIADSGDWLFAETETDWKVWTKRDGQTLGIGVSCTNGLYFVTFDASLGASFIADMGGQPFVGPDGAEYTINRFNALVAYLDRPYQGATVISNTSWNITPYRFYMPTDCARALAFLNRDMKNQWAGWIPILDRRTEERYLSPYTEFASNVEYVVDNTAEFDAEPDVGFVAADSPGAGTIAPDSDYEVCYTTTQFGRESPPSVALRVTTSAAAAHSIAITGMKDTRDGVLATGIYKNVYVRRLTSSQILPAGDFYSRWYLAVANLSEATTAYTIAAFPAANAANLIYQNGRKFMRTVWRPGQDMTLRLRYLIRPDRLVSDADVPRCWPDAYHDLIWYGAAIEVGSSRGADAGTLTRYRERYAALLKQMRDNCLLVPNAPSRRSPRGDGGGGGLGPIYTRGPAFGNYWGG